MRLRWAHIGVMLLLGLVIINGIAYTYTVSYLAFSAGSDIETAPIPHAILDPRQFTDK